MMSIDRTSRRTVSITGSRGKSAVARMIHFGLSACGVATWTRITGVLPRELSPHGERVILRPSGGHVAEMAWWLKTIDGDAQAIVMENSAVTPGLQGVCPRLLEPDVVVLTNLRPDHGQWGPSEASVLEALTPALGRNLRLVVPSVLAETAALAEVARRRGLTVCRVDTGEEGGFRAVNASLALEACRQVGVSVPLARTGIAATPSDMADFAVLNVGPSRLAFAFSANDVATTNVLFTSIGWEADSTTVLFNHRSDRPDRLSAFAPWLASSNWRRVMIVGDRPIGRWRRHWMAVRSLDDFGRLVASLGDVLGCGNAVSGWPLRFRLMIEEGRWHA